MGGLGEVGRNCTVIEIDKKLLVIDFGIMFSDPSMPSINGLFPDINWLSSRADDVAGLLVTHGHEDHVGGVVRFVSATGAPVFGSPFSIALAKLKLKEARLAKTSTTHVLADGERRKIGPFDVEVIPITHSVPQSLCVIIHTPQGVLVHTGDFKIDNTPVDGRLTGLKRLAELSANPGIRLLMSDSTNADTPGRTPSESEIGDTFRRLFPNYTGKRLIVSCFASHLHRVQQIIDVACEQGRYIFPLGRSMVTNVRIARELGLLDVPEERIKPISSLDDFDKGQICVVCTGSQGETRAALAQLANGEHASLHVKPGDVVMLSSHPIPGNERSVFGVVNKLCRLGAEVIHDGHEKVHTSGHARRDDLKEMLQTVRPEWFVPIEGEFHMLTRHAGLAIEAGVDPSRVVVVTDGARLRIDDNTMKVAGEIDVPPVMFDGSNNEVSSQLLGQRVQLSNAGLVHVTVALNNKGEMICPPDVTTQGWIDTTTDVAVLRELKAKIAVTVQSAAKGTSKNEQQKNAQQKRGGKRTRSRKLGQHNKIDVASLKRQIRRTTGRYVGQRTRLNAAIEVTVMIAD